MVTRKRLPTRFIDILVDLPEQGMGYQVVNIILKDGTILSERKVVNSTYLLLNDNEEIKTIDIVKVELFKT